MKIKFLQGIAGNTFHYRPGEVDDFDDVEAVRLINHGIAVCAETDVYQTAPVSVPVTKGKPKK